ncbi:TIGR03862 family flavoprotein [Fuscibacter oryzae]|uniref:TIGR03862 family flavoprotein n=1 Tax=Fuscibacter oryzae TaxID=2803939 RepID=A0A8J7MRU3_9RHOB|nr:TIGR03862 family flavoprotein [Fuscibacter oryzae]MBL4929133.1 TIGR03862 family flavoprotein [Fuscibacter oryzae]
MTEAPEALVIGAGPAGLMVADELARAGRRVLVAEAKPSPARKFLMAGKSGLNITKDQPDAIFQAAYPEDWIRPYLAEFGPAQVMDWARGLGQPVFTGSSGRVFPVAMKGSPLLRAWLARLDQLGVTLRTRWRWHGFDGTALRFHTPEGERLLAPKVTVLALGGSSWSRLGSDAAWAQWLAEKGVQLAPFRPANMGFAVDWSPHMARHFGQPVKGAALIVGNRRERGEFVLSAKGIEGGGIYAVSREMGEGTPLTLDLMPDVAAADLSARLARMKPGESLANCLRKLGLAPAAAALVMEFGRSLDTAQAIKSLPFHHAGSRPLDEAISTAGGIAAASLTPDLELHALPGIFAAGEMLDWQAPTGGYLLTACLATGRHAGRAAARLDSATPHP